jgi:formylglycine-generating enzyme required for sulfatase activity
VDPLSGIDFVTVGAVNNPAWPGDGTPGALTVGRGSVPYAYRIGRLEVTTAQWVEFFNAAFDRPAADRIPHLIPPDHWGAAPASPTTPGGQRWQVLPGRELAPVGSISWRMAAIYCNWLCNAKGSARSAFLSGAYDVSTFGFRPGTSYFTDQLTHAPGAAYWIPTWDEWLKAAHYDPNKNGSGQGGWWLYPTTSDTLPAYGPPGTTSNGRPAQANAGWDTQAYPGRSPFDVSLGAYPAVASPWGLLDAAGGTREWTEGWAGLGGPEFRYAEGSAWNDSGGAAAQTDIINLPGGDFPNISTYDYGFRIASAVPTPPASVMVFLYAVVAGRRVKRQGDRRGIETNRSRGRGAADGRISECRHQGRS